jgi:aryl-phospho-beta-D-glucosidase BglC (GH1 family)
MRYPADHALGVQRNGVNNTQMEKSSIDPSGPTHNQYPHYSDKLLNWYQQKGVKSVRLTFSWEAVQSGLGAASPVPPSGSLYADYWDELARPLALPGPKSAGVVQRLLTRGIYVTLALWQGNSAINDTDITYRNLAFSKEDFSDFWGKFATAINAATANDQRVSFDLINEPHLPMGGSVGIDLADWVERSKAAIAAIRATGATNTILWPGMWWTSANKFVETGSADAFLDVRQSDPLNNIAVTVHDYTGTDYADFAGLGDPNLTTAVSGAFTRKPAAQQNLLDWARTNGVKIQVGEVAVDLGKPAGSAQLGHDQWTDWTNFCLANDDVIVGWHWWANSEGDWWTEQDSAGARTWGLTLDNGDSQTVYANLIESSFPTPFLVLRDNMADPGTGVNVTTTVAWESPDIWVSPATIVGGAPATVFVRVTNRGGRLYPGPGTDVVQLFWAKAQAGMGWPNPWDGSLPLYGGAVAPAQPVPAMAAGADAVLAFNWPATPDPTKYPINDGHFCLLAVVTKNPAMVTSPVAPFDGFVGSNLNSNILRFSHVASRNIHVVHVAADVQHLGGLVVANHTDADVRAQVTFETLNRRGEEADAPGRIILTPRDIALDRIREFGDPENLEDLGEGVYGVVDPASGIVGLQLRSGDELAFDLKLAGDQNATNYAIRAVQYTLDGDQRTSVGGQTFTAGEVDGW